jgi:hypothetical protein
MERTERAPSCLRYNFRTIGASLAFRSTAIAAQSEAIQSAPALASSSYSIVVSRARTRAPAALPDRMPAGASSITTQSSGARFSSSAPLA